MAKFLSSAFLSIILFYLETIDEKKCGSEEILCLLQNSIFNYRIWYALVSILIFTLYQFYLVYKEGNKVSNNVYDFIHHFFENKLEKDKLQNRITVFQAKPGYSIIFNYLFHSFKRWGYYKQNNKLKIRFDKTPMPWFKYLVIHSRFGVPNENYRSTVFKVTNDEKDADSFIQYTYHSGQIESASLPNIYDIDLKKCRKLEDVARNKKSDVKKYMEKSKLKSFESLRILGRRTPYIAAIPLFLKKKSMNYPTHIIMFDSNSISFEEIESSLKELAEHIEIILKNA